MNFYPWTISLEDGSSFQNVYTRIDSIFRAMLEVSSSEKKKFEIRKIPESLVSMV